MEIATAAAGELRHRTGSQQTCYRDFDQGWIPQRRNIESNEKHIHFYTKSNGDH